MCDWKWFYFFLFASFLPIVNWNIEMTILLNNQIRCSDANKLSENFFKMEQKWVALGKSTKKKNKKLCSRKNEFLIWRVLRCKLINCTRSKNHDWCTWAKYNFIVNCEWRSRAFDFLNLFQFGIFEKEKKNENEKLLCDIESCILCGTVDTHC